MRMGTILKTLHMSVVVNRQKKSMSLIIIVIIISLVRYGTLTMFY